MGSGMHSKELEVEVSNVPSDHEEPNLVSRDVSSDSVKSNWSKGKNHQRLKAPKSLVDNDNISKAVVEKNKDTKRVSSIPSNKYSSLFLLTKHFLISYR
jgi:hypothetical protein